MRATDDRIDELFGGLRHNRRALVTPEGVPLDVTIAGAGDRAIAFAIDFAIILAVVGVLVILASYIVKAGIGADIGETILLFTAFLVRTCYFTHFELAWQGKTPGKKRCGLRVINRDGGELTSSAVVARNLIREVEFFLPLCLLFGLDEDSGKAAQLTLAGWAFLVASLPLWNKDRLRAGDIIAGTQVVSVPKRDLESDLSIGPAAETNHAYTFTPEQLKKYGAFELQVLEEILRRPPAPGQENLLRDVCDKIRRKIGYADPVPTHNVHRFLKDFYTAERTVLERDKLFGRMREDKDSPAEKR